VFYPFFSCLFGVKFRILSVESRITVYGDIFVEGNYFQFVRRQISCQRGDLDGFSILVRSQSVVIVAASHQELVAVCDYHVG